MAGVSRRSINQPTPANSWCGSPVTWRVLAKDGADLSRPKVQPAHLQFGPGETTDAEITPGAGPVTIRVKAFNKFESVLPVRSR